MGRGPFDRFGASSAPPEFWEHDGRFFSGPFGGDGALLALFPSSGTGGSPSPAPAGSASFPPVSRPVSLRGHFLSFAHLIGCAGLWNTFLELSRTSFLER